MCIDHVKKSIKKKKAVKPFEAYCDYLLTRFFFTLCLIESFFYNQATCFNDK